MKFCKIRLTKCAKTKLGEFKDVCITMLTAVSIFTVLAIGIPTVVAILGLVAHGIIIATQGNLIGFPSSIIEMGLLVLIFIASLVGLSLVGFLIFDSILKPITLGITKTLKVIVKTDEHFECPIFERCDD